MGDDLLSFDLGFNAGFEVNIHPLVPLQILDLYYRKYGYLRGNEENKNIRIAGSLVGTLYTNKVHITNCFAVPVEEDPDDPEIFTLDFNEHKSYLETHQQIYPNDVLLGAYVTGTTDLDLSVAYLSQEYAKKENYFFTTATFTQPIILKFDPSLTNEEYQMKVFRLNQSLKDFSSVASFNTLSVKIEFMDEQYSQAVAFLERDDGQQVNNFKLVNIENVQDITKEAHKNIETLIDYVQSIIVGKTKGNEILGKQLLSYLNKLQLTQTQEFVQQYKTQAQEAQLVHFLSNLALAQTMISEKLCKI